MFLFNRKHISNSQVILFILIVNGILQFRGAGKEERKRMCRRTPSKVYKKRSLENKLASPGLLFFII